MKPTNIKPLVTISTYEERQAELNKIKSIEKDGTEHSQNEINKTENSLQVPVPPPPPLQLTNSIGSQKLQAHLMSQCKLESPVLTPTPDYDSTLYTIKRNEISSTKHNNANKTKANTIENVISIVSANEDTAELELIESYKFQNSSSAIPKPPSLYFTLQNAGPPTMKKTNNNRNVAITVGEYGCQKIRKEPAKLDFISKSNEINNDNSYKHLQLNDNYKNDSVSEKLRHELEKTLSRSNLRKRNEFDTNLQNQQNNNSNTNNSGIATTSNGKNSSNLLKSSLSPNIEKLANMLQSRYCLNNDNDILSNPNQNKNSSVESSNKITISVPSNKHQELQMTESAPPFSSSMLPMNGILKNCHTTKSSNFGEKSITFEN